MESLSELDDLFETAIRQRLADLHTHMPGTILSYNAEKNTARVRPGNVRVFVDGQSRPYPDLPDVPVCMWSFNNFSIRPPDDALINAGCLLLFGESSYDEWFSGDGSPKDPKEYRKFSVSDAVALVGFNPISKLTERKSGKNSLEVRNGDSILELGKDGFKFSANGSELISTLIELLETLLDAKTITSIGPQPFYGATIKKLVEIKNRVEGLKL